jgi:transcription elongation factor Elf1
MGKKHSKPFLVPTTPKPTKSQCPKCDSRKVLVDHNPEWGTWFDWYACGDCGHEWQTDEEFPVKVTNFRFFQAPD